MSYVDFNVVACVVACDNFEGVRTVIRKKIQIPYWRLDFYWVRCSGFFLFFVFFVFFFLFLFCFCFDSDIKCISDCLTIKRKTRSYKFLLYFFFRKEWQAVFFNPQLRIHNINNAYLIALDNCYYVKIKLDCVYLFLNSSK